MHSTILHNILLAVLVATNLCAAESTSNIDWPQWRGPNRNGVVVNSPKLLDSWPKEGPPLLWKSAWIPSHYEGGCGGPVVTDGKVFLYANAKLPVNGGTSYRLITTEILLSAGWLPDLPEGLGKKIEEAWLSPDRPNSNGWPWWQVKEAKEKDKDLDAFLAKKPELDKFIKDFMTTLKADDTRKYGAYIKQRLSIHPKGVSGGFTWEELVNLSKLREVGCQSSSEWMKVLAKAIGNKAMGLEKHVFTHSPFFLNAWKRAFKMCDSLICLDAASGKELWRKDFPVDPGFLEDDKNFNDYHVGFFGALGVCGTPTVWGGKCYFAGNSGLYCLSAKDGALLWQVKGDPEHASVLVASNVVYHCGSAYDAETGKFLWKTAHWKGPLWNDQRNLRFRLDAGPRYSSPMLWISGGRHCVISTDGTGNSGEGRGGEIWCLDLKTGKDLWTLNYINPYPLVVLGIDGDTLTLQGKSYKMTPSGAEPLNTFIDEQYSAYFHHLMDQGHLYVTVGPMEGRRVNVYGICCFELKSGAKKWSNDSIRAGNTSMSPQILADGKIFVFESGDHGPTAISMVKADPERFVKLGSFSPNLCKYSCHAIAGGKLFLRLTDCLACYDLRNPGASR